MFCVAITGGIASGKSTVAQMFIDHGIPVIDADTMARKVVEPGRTAWKKLRVEFGDEIFNEDKTVNRERLSEVIFNNREKRRKLNEITHPEIMKAMIFAAVKVGMKGYPFVVMDIPLLYETGEMVELMHKIIAVNCDEDIQMKRLVRRNNITAVQAMKRISSQMPLDLKCQRADLVVENSGTIEETREQVEKIIKYLKTLKFHYKIRFYLFLVALLLILLFIYFFFIF